MYDDLKRFLCAKIEEKLHIPKDQILSYSRLIEESKICSDEDSFGEFLDKTDGGRELVIKTHIDIIRELDHFRKEKDLTNEEKKYLELLMSESMMVIFNLTEDFIAGYYAFALIQGNA